MLQQILSSLDGLTALEQKEVLRVLMSKEDRLAKVKALLGINGTDQDEVLLFVVQTVEDLVLSYINQDTLPAPLENALIVMCVSYYKAAGLGTTQAAVGPVASVKRGDVTTSFANASGASGSASTFNLGADGQDFFGWRTVLNEYRKVRWRSYVREPRRRARGDRNDLRRHRHNQPDGTRDGGEPHHKGRPRCEIL